MLKNKPLTQLMVIFLIANLPLHGQIQYQTSYSHSGTFANLETDGYKFYVMDVGSEQCRLYNQDYSLWKTIQFNIPPNRWLTDIEFVSQKLFDSDEGVEMLYVYYQYVETANSYYYIYTTCVIDDNGAVLLEIPGGSWSEIINIHGDGARLMVYVYDYSSFPYKVETRLYRLPGQLTGIQDPDRIIFSPDSPAVFPNPVSTMLHVPVSPNLDIHQAVVVVMDLHGQLILRQPVQSSLEEVDMKKLGLSPGTYLVRLESAMFQTKLQQVIVTN